MTKSDFFDLIKNFKHYELYNLIENGSCDYDNIVISNLLDIDNYEVKQIIHCINNACESLAHFYNENEEFYNEEFKCFFNEQLQNAEFLAIESFEENVIHVIERVFYKYKEEIISDSDLIRLAKRVF